MFVTEIAQSGVLSLYKGRMSALPSHHTPAFGLDVFTWTYV